MDWARFEDGVLKVGINVFFVGEGSVIKLTRCCPYFASLFDVAEHFLVGWLVVAVPKLFIESVIYAIVYWINLILHDGWIFNKFIMVPKGWLYNWTFRFPCDNFGSLCLDLAHCFGLVWCCLDFFHI